MENAVDGALIAGVDVGGALVQQSRSGLMVALPEDHADTAVFSKGKAFLPLVALQVATSNSVKKEKFPVDHYGLRISKTELQDLGEQIVCIPQAWRFVATQNVKNIQTGKNEFTACFDKTSPMFLDFKAKAEVKGQRTHGFGTELLIWLPELGQYAILPFTSATSRNIWTDIYNPEKNVNRMGQTIVMGSKPIDDGQNQWSGMTVSSYAGQIDSSKLPSEDDFKAAMGKFPTKGYTTSVQANPEGVVTVEGGSAAPSRG